MHPLYNLLEEMRGEDESTHFAKHLGIRHDKFLLLMQGLQAERPSVRLSTIDTVANHIGRDTLQLTRGTTTIPILGVDEDFSVELGEVLRMYRVTRGLTQEYTARQAGIPESAVSKYERGLQGMTIGTLEGLRVPLAFDHAFLVKPVYNFERFIPHNT